MCKWPFSTEIRTSNSKDASPVVTPVLVVDLRTRRRALSCSGFDRWVWAALPAFSCKSLLEGVDDLNINDLPRSFENDLLDDSKWIRLSVPCKTWFGLFIAPLSNTILSASSKITWAWSNWPSALKHVLIVQHTAACANISTFQWGLPTLKESKWKAMFLTHAVYWPKAWA